MEHQLKHRIFGIAALLLSTMTGVLFAGPRHVLAEEVPNATGLPGLNWSYTVPSARSAPFRAGIQYGMGNYDPEGGIDVDLQRADLRSQDLRLQLQLKAADAVRLSAGIPLRFLSLEGGESVSGLGDIQGFLGARVLTVGRTGVGLWGGVTLPTGAESEGLTTGKIDGEVGLITQTRFFGGGFAPQTSLVFNLGYRFNKDERDGYGWRDGNPSETGGFFPIYPAIAEGGGDRENDQVLLRAALHFRQRWGAVFLEWSADWYGLNDELGYSESPSWITPGVIFGDGTGPSLRASWSIGFADDDPSTEFVPRVPDWYGQVAVSMPLYFGGRDRDGDYIRDRDDACPDEPEDIDGFEDDDGCPDTDNDGDGILDARDAAPHLAEDVDGFQDQDGRPDLDNDFDGIADTDDDCPNQPEDFDGDRDQDGCPDLVLDADGDSIPDAEDSCPGEPEDFDGFEDEDGCPDPDNDLDGIVDEQDECPHDAEDYDGDRDEDGCPDGDVQDS